MIVFINIVILGNIKLIKFRDKKYIFLNNKIKNSKVNISKK